MFSALADRCRDLRGTQTDAESVVWQLLRNHQLGVKFRRQHQFGPFVLDFFCAEARLAVELDGGQHYSEDGLAKDQARSQYLEARGITLLRFSNLDVLKRPVSVVEATWLALNPHPGPLPEGEGE